MKQLIAIHNNNGERVVNARELHTFLKSKQEFSAWIKNRIERYGFIENQDYTSFDKVIKRANGGTLRKEYAISVDMAKELSMVEATKAGQTARRYFLAIEKKYKEELLNRKPISKIEALEMALAAEKKALALAEKASFADRVMDNDNLIDVGQAAKLLKLPYGRNTLFSKLREDGIFFKNRNEPKQQFIESGFFELRENLIPRNNHEDLIVTKVLVTQKGLYWLSRKYVGSTPRTSIPALKIS